MTRESKITLMTSVILAGFIAAAGFHYFLYSEAIYPFNTFLFRPLSRFSDFLTNYRIALDPYRFNKSNYQNFPFLYFTARMFTPLSPNAALATLLAIFSGSFIGIGFHFLKRPSTLLTLQSVLVTLLSYPFLFAFDRANLTFLGFILVVIFLILYQRNSKWAFLCLGLAISLKITNGVFIVLLLADKKYREMIMTGLVVALAALGSYAILPGGLIANIQANLVNLRLYTGVYAVDNGGFYFGHSLFGALKYLYIVLEGKLITPATVTRLMQPYPYLVLLLFGAIIIYILLFEKVLWKRLLVIVLPMLLFPYVSADYNLLFIFLPLFYLINQAEKSPWDWFYVVTLALLLIPKDYLRLNLLPEASITILLNPLIMLALLATTILRGLVSAIQDRKPAIIPALDIPSNS